MHGNKRVYEPGSAFSLLLTTLLLTTLMLAFGSTGHAQPSLSVQIVTDSAVPNDFGTFYPLGQLRNDSYVYGSEFLIRISYSDVSGSLSLAFSGGQANYLLAWRVAGTTDNNPFTSNLGADVSGLSGSSSDLYYRHDGTLQLLSSEATRYRIGARSTASASQDLSLFITLTATVN